MKKIIKVLIILFILMQSSFTQAYYCPSSYRAAWPLWMNTSVWGGEIKWTGDTDYLVALDEGVDVWNEMSPIDISYTSSYWSSDLVVSDEYEIIADPRKRWQGRWNLKPYIPDTLKFNRALLDKKKFSEKKHTAIHELGHALGLKHSYYPNIMYYKLTKKISLGWQDKQCYNYNWNN